MKCNCGKHKYINLKPVLKTAIVFFLEGEETSFLIIDDYPFNKLPFPSIGEKVSLESYVDFISESGFYLNFDYYIVKDIYHHLCNPETETTAYIEVTVEGCYIDCD